MLKREVVRMGEDSILETLKPTGGKILYLIAGGLIDRFGINYVMDKYKEFRAKENEELAKNIAKLGFSIGFARAYASGPEMIKHLVKDLEEKNSKLEEIEKILKRT